jgi:PAS domain S-box-containing protein
LSDSHQDAENSPRRIAEEKRRLERIVHSAMDAIITIDGRHNIILFNPAAEQMFGVDLKDVLGKPISQFIPRQFRAEHQGHIEQFHLSGEAGRRAMSLGPTSGLRADGVEFPIESSISQVEVDGDVLSTVILRDITERRANEESRLMLVREVDHRAKNALAVVQSLVSLTTAPTQEAFATAIRGRISTLARAHSLLAESRWQGAQIDELVRSETSAYARPEQLSLGGPPVTLTSQSVQPLALLLHELATNAVKYGALSVPHGIVSCIWKFCDNGAIKITWSEEGGPAPDSTRTQGFGSTLIDTVSRQQLRGQLEITWPRTGLCLQVVLPAACFQTPESPHSSASAANPSSAQATNRRPSVLIVEDEALVGLELKQNLTRAGWDVIGPASSLQQAYSTLASNQPIDAAILDINIDNEPVYPFAEKLQTQGLPFMFCTGYAITNHSSRFNDCPVVVKPTLFSELLNTLNTLVSRPPAGTQAAP